VAYLAAVAPADAAHQALTVVRLRQTRKHWEAFGLTDPLWAICTDESVKNNRWSVDEFFRSGEGMIDQVMEHLDRIGASLHLGRALDFGCGVGRLTQMLCTRFDSADGVDVAASMIELARSYNKHADRCRYHVNTHDDLRLFDDAHFDLVLSMLVLQHMAPVYAKRYIAEFVRVLRPGGIAYFQVPDSMALPARPPLPATAHRARLSAGFSLLELHPGEERTVNVRVTNDSEVTWPASTGPGDVTGVPRLGNHWRSSRGGLVTRDDGRTTMPRPVGPGESIDVELCVCAPATPRRYVLEFDLVEEGVTWFELRGSPTLRIPVVVSGSAVADRPTQQAPRARRVLDRLRRRPSSPVMEMHCVPRDQVLEVVRGAAATVIDVARFVDAGDGFASYRYVVSR
jgi:SAM-dependent methyltransferase